MNCERCQTELEDFLYGELSERQAGELRSHLAACAECAAVRDDLERENELFARFYEQTAIEPAGEMWEALRQRMAADPVRQVPAEVRTPRVGWWQSLALGMFGSGQASMLRQAALALLLIALSVTATVLLMKRTHEGSQIAGNLPKESATPAPQSITTPTPPPAAREIAANEPEKSVAPPTKSRALNARREPAPSQPLSDQELLARQLARAEREYQGAIKMLDRAIAKRRDSIEPEAFKQYETSLALIDNSIAQSKRALHDRPDDLAAGQFLLSAYAKKVELMQTIAMN